MDQALAQEEHMKEVRKACAYELQHDVGAGHLVHAVYGQLREMSTWNFAGTIPAPTSALGSEEPSKENSDTGSVLRRMFSTLSPPSTLSTHSIHLHHPYPRYANRSVQTSSATITPVIRKATVKKPCFTPLFHVEGTHQGQAQTETSRQKAYQTEAQGPIE